MSPTWPTASGPIPGGSTRWRRSTRPPSRGDPDRVIRELDEAIRVHGLHVIKFIPEYAYRAGSAAWDDGPFRPFWEAATALGVPVAFTLGASPGHADERDGYLAELGILQRWMERYPDTQVYLTHGFPYRAFLEATGSTCPTGSGSRSRTRGSTSRSASRSGSATCSIIHIARSGRRWRRCSAQSAPGT